MQINVRGKNVQVTDALRQYVEKRLQKLDRYLEKAGEAQITLAVAKDRHRVEVTVPLNGFILRGEEETGDMYSSVDLVIDKLEKQLSKYKTRLAKQLRGESLKDLANNNAVVIEETEPRVLRTKRFNIKPMSLEEAIMQMNLVGHSFFVFASDETEEINVVYRRKDGNYGLIEPK